jgi:transcriptional regulator with XRE-family HTH domain
MQTDATALRRLRERRGHTITSLAGACGLSKQRLSQLETDPDQRGIRPTTAKRIADALGVTIDDITIDDVETVA